MIVLYINCEHCTSLEQLKGYFSENLTPENDIYADLLDYGRHGDIAAWLLELGESELSSRVDSIDRGLCDSAFYTKLKAIIIGVDEDLTDSEPLKPAFDKCFSFEDIDIQCNDKDTEVKVNLSFKVLMSVNEEYYLRVTSKWGTRGIIINPYSHPEGQIVNLDFTFRKRPEKDIVGEMIVTSDDESFYGKITVTSDDVRDIPLPSVRSSSPFYENETIKDIIIKKRVLSQIIFALKAAADL